MLHQLIRKPTPHKLPLLAKYLKKNRTQISFVFRDQNFISEDSTDNQLAKNYKLILQSIR